MKVTLITGERNSGKSERFLEAYRKVSTGIAICSEKMYDEDQVTGYRMRLLPDGISCPFIESEEEMKDFDRYEYQGHFRFRKEAFDRAIQFVMDHKEADTVWIDEVGKLELSGKGFAPLIRLLVKQDRDMVLVVRAPYVKTFCDLFLPDDCLISIKEKAAPTS